MKSNVSDLQDLVQCVYLDACAKCSADVADLRDLKTIRSRVESEGLSFLTITLPNFCKDFEQALQNGCVDSTLFAGFRKNGVIPAFLQGILSQLFDRATGGLYESEETPTLVESVRQICLLFKKVLLPCTPERAEAAVFNFQEVERANHDFVFQGSDRRFFRDVSDCLWGSMLGNFCQHELLPRHGPGSTAEGILGNSKFLWRRWHERLESVVPFYNNCYSHSSYVDDDPVLEKVTFVPEQDEQPVRVVLVPKTLKGPRTIAIEPVAMQYAQQAIRDYLYEVLESSYLTKGHVNFTDQSINKEQAIRASIDGSLSTIDLSDASDRVLDDIVHEMLACCPELLSAVDSCRSRKAELPTGQILDLKKFASMGSALCFPIESMYFYTICVVALLRKYNLPISRANIFRVTRGVYIYGDDIIVPTDEADIVIDHLHKYNCKVNSAKTFTKGKFRESCGTDAWGGYEVTPVYIRRMRPDNKQADRELISWIATANLFYLKGYWRTASLMFSTCERILGFIPYVSPDSPSVGRISLLGYRSASRWSNTLHRLEIKGFVPSSVYRCDEIDGYPALQKSLLALERRHKPSASTRRPSLGPSLDPSFEPLVVADDHLERTARRGAVVLKHRWVPAT